MSKQMNLFDSEQQIEIIDDPQAYGSKGQSWDPTFISYMKSIVTNPIYANMPDAVKDDGKIQWEAPSNRSGGQYLSLLIIETADAGLDDPFNPLR